MEHSLQRFVFLLTLLALPAFTQAQQAPAPGTYTIAGRVTDAATGAGIPFASIAIKGLPVGTTSDEEGRYSLRTKQLTDSLQVLSLGYQTRFYRLLVVSNQTVDAQLTAAATKLQEVKIYAKKGDPAYRIIREVVKRRDQYDPSRLSAYEYDSYTKIEGYLNNFDQKSGKKRRSGPIGRLLGKLPAITDANGQTAVPVFVSETFSQFFARSNPEKQKEKVLNSHVAGVGVGDGGLIAQLTGASFQQYNFYRNSLFVLRKDIPSPVGGQWDGVYIFRLRDTVQVGNAVCYRIEFSPKRVADLAFDGTIWIDTLSYALTQVQAHVGKRANINFVDELRIEQEWEQTASGILFPTQTQVMIDTDQPVPGAPGALIRFFATARNIVENKPKNADFYDPAIELADGFRTDDPAFWTSVRPERFSPAELRAIQVVDSVRNVPLMKVVGGAIKIATLGYIPVPKLHIEIGPFVSLYANNNIEGNRLRLGGRTTIGFSKKWLLTGYVAYGTLDRQFKYNVGVERILNRNHWTVLGVRYSYDLERVGLSTDNLGGNSFFAAYSRYGTIRRPYFQEDKLLYLRREIGSGFTQTLALRHRSFDPLFPFAFQPQPQDDDQNIRSSYAVTEVTSETRFAPDEVILQNDNTRFSTGATRKPIVTLRYTLGLRNLLNSDFMYHRISLSLRHSFRMGILGRSYYTIDAGIIPSTVPYTLLYTPLGNESLFYVGNAYNLMNYFEFVTDRWATVRYEHNFGGLLFNRIPVLNRLKWRELVTANVLFGSVSKANVALIPPTDGQGRPVEGFSSLSGTPYVELGYGIDNIFKVFRVDAIHRLTYLDNVGRTGIPVTPFSIKVSGWLAF